MRYDQFREALTIALREAGLWMAGDEAMETIELRSTTRKWKVYLGRGHGSAPSLST
jgi:hypothetical protein